MLQQLARFKTGLTASNTLVQAVSESQVGDGCISKTACQSHKWCMHIQDHQQTAGLVLCQQTLSQSMQTSVESSFEAEQQHQLRCALTALVYYVVPSTLTTNMLEAARAYILQLYELPDSMLLDTNVQGLACAWCRIALFLDAWQVVCTYTHSACVSVTHA